MKICLRYLSSKSPLSERRLAIAALKVFLRCMIISMSVSLFLRAEVVSCAQSFLMSDVLVYGLLSFTLGRHSPFDAVHDLGHFYGRESQFTAAHSPKRCKDNIFWEYY